MKKYILMAVIAAWGLVVHAPQAEARRLHHTPHHATRHHGAGVDSSATYADIVIDAETGRVIHETDSDSLRHPASLTKMMTLYITFQALESGHLNLGQYLPVSENASYQSPSKLGLHAGQHIRVEDAILGLVTESANDAAVVLGEALGGSEEGFGLLMTKQAHALGMTKTIFHNPSGLPDPDQVTTAHDMAVLGDALINHYPNFYPYFSHDSFTYAGIYHHNHNHLMDRYEGMDGIKTGYIRASGFNLVASARRNGTRLIGVIFGGRSAVARDNSMAVLLDHSFAAAQAEARGGHMAATTGEGDSNDSDSPDYVTLPSKVSAIFPSHGGAQITDVGPTPTPTPAPPAQVLAQALVPQPVEPPAAAAPVPTPAPVDASAQPALTPAAQASVGSSIPPSSNKPLTSTDTSPSKSGAPPVAAANDSTKGVDHSSRPVVKTKIVQKAVAKPVEKPTEKPAEKIAMLVPPAPLANAPSAPTASSWGIQIGAYSDAAIGKQALSDLVASMTDLLTGGEPQVLKVSAGGVVMYRARLMSLDKKTAQSVCSYLIQHGKSCLTVEP